MKVPRRPISACPSCRHRILHSFGIQTPPSQTLLPKRRHYTRPSTAPRVSIDLKHIRQNPGLYSQNCADRRYENLKEHSWRIIELHEKAQKANRDARPIREKLNKLHHLLPKADAADRDALLGQAKALRPQLEGFEKVARESEKDIQELAEDLPNLTSRDTPVGDTGEAVGYINEGVERRGGLSHVDIGAKLDLLDFEGAASTSGWGWYFLKNEAALLEQALIQYALSVAMKRGWRIVSPPSMVYAHMADACGFQPRDKNEEQQIYAIEQAERDKSKPGLVMAGTAEIPLAGMKANTTLAEAELPLKYIGVSRCYRAEAGARGADTKGLYRVHEFTKAEMFGWTLPDMPADPSSKSGDMFEASEITSHSAALFDEMLEIQTEILQSLGLHCRILEMPTHDLGASASRKRDIEAFFPSRTSIDDGWGELTSASICTDYQSRRLATRVKIEKLGKTDYPHTVNGTAMAVPRVLACILENGYDKAKNVVTIPEVLRPWMGGQSTIGKQ